MCLDREPCNDEGKTDKNISKQEEQLVSSRELCKSYIFFYLLLFSLLYQEMLVNT